MKSVDLVTTSNWKHYTKCKNKTKNVFTKDALEKNIVILICTVQKIHLYKLFAIFNKKILRCVWN